MARPDLTNINATDTFQVWFNKTNELIDLFKTDIITATPGAGDITTGNTTLLGTFTADNLIGDTVKFNTISNKDFPNSPITFESPVKISTSVTESLILESSIKPSITMRNEGNMEWIIGFDDDSASSALTIGRDSNNPDIFFFPGGGLGVDGFLQVERSSSFGAFASFNGSGPEGNAVSITGGHLLMGGNRIRDMADPVDPGDAVTLRFLQSSGGGGGSLVTASATTVGAMKYNGLDRDSGAGAFYGGNLEPTENIRLNYNGNFVAQAIRSTAAVTVGGFLGVKGFSVFEDGVQMENNLNMNNTRILALAEPENLSDAATKGYVDANSGGSASLLSATSTQIGAIKFNGVDRQAGMFYGRPDLNPPTSGANARLGYDGNIWADGMVLSSFLTMGGTLTVDGFVSVDHSGPEGNAMQIRSGHLNMTSNRIRNVANPVDNSDVATKSYVDANSGGSASLLSANSTQIGAIQFNGADRQAGMFYNGTLEPNTTTILKYNGNFVAHALRSVAAVTVGGFLGVKGFSVFEDGVQMENNLNMNNTRILNVANPVNSSDAATKAYVDANSGGSGGITSLSGGTGINVTGSGSSRTISVNNTVVRTSGDYNLSGGLRMQFIETNGAGNIGGFLSCSSGASFGGNVTMGQNQITNLGAPTLNPHAATKGYVDSQVGSSDYRLKENLREPVAWKEMLDKIKVYDFEWKEDGETGTGVLAHELEKFFPKAVMNEKDGEEPQRVYYDRLVPHLICAYKDLQEKEEVVLYDTTFKKKKELVFENLDLFDRLVFDVLDLSVSNGTKVQVSFDSGTTWIDTGVEFSDTILSGTVTFKFANKNTKTLMELVFVDDGDGQMYTIKAIPKGKITDIRVLSNMSNNISGYIRITGKKI